ncbi:UNVERIFIED_CONTAM: hypothetical protein Scaly_0997800 [Sesamum calycinum]|uniref:Reverse transcriptase/retrotransposon-derived protein RNase H-like domain-containing protein n=1 Tax=Sesamum calycinum TaxID=2727403 RepID=A0AAW2QZB9_9LAMI
MKLSLTKYAFGVLSGRFLGDMSVVFQSSKLSKRTKSSAQDEACQQAFQDLRIYLVELPLLTKLALSEPLHPYPTVRQYTISFVLIKKEKGHQEPIYYVSKVLHGAEQRYPEVVELSEYDISYQLRTAVKAQALAKFGNEAMLIEEKEGKWLLHVNGSSTLAGNGVKLVLTSSMEDELNYTLRFDFKVSNNEAEYEALIVGIRMTYDSRARNLIAHPDSQPVTN